MNTLATNELHDLAKQGTNYAAKVLANITRALGCAAVNALST